MLRRFTPQHQPMAYPVSSSSMPQRVLSGVPLPGSFSNSNIGSPVTLDQSVSTPSASLSNISPAQDPSSPLASSANAFPSLVSSSQGSPGTGYFPRTQPVQRFISPREALPP